MDQKNKGKSNKPYLPVKQKQISTLVFEQLRDSIFRGKLKPGDQLLPERELAETMQVSRTSVRNAITQLITMGFLETRQGRGTFVLDGGSGDASNPMANIISANRSSVDELLEYRVGLGAHGVSLAALRATASDIRFLEEVLEKGREDGCDAQKGTESDIAFHMGIAYATHNSVYVDMTKRFYDYMFYRLKELHVQLYEIDTNVEEIDRQHEAILAAIRAHDPEDGRRHMLAHIEFLRTLLRTSDIS